MFERADRVDLMLARPVGIVRFTHLFPIGYEGSLNFLVCI